jgi:hypothetical protein
MPNEVRIIPMLLGLGGIFRFAEEINTVHPYNTTIKRKKTVNVKLARSRGFSKRLRPGWALALQGTREAIHDIVYTNQNTKR